MPTRHALFARRRGFSRRRSEPTASVVVVAPLFLLLAVEIVEDHTAREAPGVDAELGRDVKGAVKELRAAGKQVAALSKNLNKIAEDIQTNQGTAHALFYGTEGTEAIRNIRDTFSQLNTILTDVREGHGAVNQLIYGELDQSFMDNLQSASEDIAFITKEMREGKGTIGALLTDPSVYEDIKRLVGDLERNDILRALVRYSIRRDEPRPSVEVTEE